MPAAHNTSAQRWRALHGLPPGQARERRARRAADPVQREADRLRKTQRWVRLRAWFLRGHPLCARCATAGRTEAAGEVDHIVPVRTLLVTGQRERAFDPANLQALCTRCHARKSAAERAARARRGGGAVPPGGEGCVSNRGDAESAGAPLPKNSRVSKVPGEAPPGAPVPDTLPGPASVEAMAAVLSHVHGFPRAAARGQITAALDRGDRHLEVNDDHR